MTWGDEKACKTGVGVKFDNGNAYCYGKFRARHPNLEKRAAARADKKTALYITMHVAPPRGPS